MIFLHLPRPLLYGTVALKLALVGSLGCAAPFKKLEPTVRHTKNGADPKLNSQYVSNEGRDWTPIWEVESREIFRKRLEIFEALELKRGMTVADVGAGSGLFTVMFARRLAQNGTVIAVDVSRNMVDKIVARTKKEGLTNVVGIVGTQTNTKLPDSSVDIVFTSDTYHHFEQIEAILSSIHRSLKPSGKFVVIDFERIAAISPPAILNHVRAGRAEVIKEIQSAGFRLHKEVKDIGLKENYYLIFSK